MNKHKHWSSEEWERLFKKEDISITAYFKELSKYIDLPEEEGLILGSMFKRDLMPEDYSEVGLTENSYEGNDYIELENTYNTQRTLGLLTFKELFEISERIIGLLSFSAGVKKTIGIKLLFLIGKIISMQADIVEIEEDDYVELRKAILKRQLKLLNNTIGLVDSGIIDESIKKNITTKLYSVREQFMEARLQIV